MTYDRDHCDIPRDHCDIPRDVKLSSFRWLTVNSLCERLLSAMADKLKELKLHQIG